MDNTPVNQIIFVIVAAVVILGGRMLLNTARMNADPVQRQLVDLIEHFFGRTGREGLEQTDFQHFASGVLDVFIENGILNHGKQQTRLAHALSAARRNLTPVQYERARKVLRSY